MSGRGHDGLHITLVPVTVWCVDIDANLESVWANRPCTSLHRDQRSKIRQRKQWPLSSKLSARRLPSHAHMPLALALLLSLSLGLTRADSYCEQATATARLACIPGEMITAINFASFGSPAGACGAYRATPSSSPTAISLALCPVHMRCAATRALLLISLYIIAADDCASLPCGPNAVCTQNFQPAYYVSCPCAPGFTGPASPTGSLCFGRVGCSIMCLIPRC